MNDTIKPNAYLMRGALPSVERSRDEYTGSVFGSAALAYITMLLSHLPARPLNM